MVEIVTTAGDKIVVGASENPNVPVRMTVRARVDDGDPAVEVLLDEGSNDVLRSVLLALWQETSWSARRRSGGAE